MPHTPGPWRIVDGGSNWSVVSEETDSIVVSSQHGYKADAALIAAAPDLLAALHALMEWEASAASGNPKPTVEEAARYMDIMEMAVTAYAKATT